MAKLSPSRELRAILRRHKTTLDDPLSISLIIEARDRGLISDSEWLDVHRWVEAALQYVAEQTSRSNEVISVDADPRNADWLKIVRARRLAGYEMPSWAALWLWLISVRHDEPAYWRTIAEICRTKGVPRIEQA